MKNEFNLESGVRARISGDSKDLWIADYNVRVSSGVEILETPAHNARKVYVRIDNIDGDSDVCTFVRRSRILPL